MNTSQEEAEGEEQHEAQAVRLGGGAPRSPLLDILVVGHLGIVQLKWDGWTIDCFETNSGGTDNLSFSRNINTERGVLSVARFCYVFPRELRGPAWAVGSYSISQSAGGTSQNIICKTLRQIGRPALYKCA